MLTEQESIRARLVLAVIFGPVFGLMMTGLFVAAHLITLYFTDWGGLVMNGMAVGGALYIGIPAIYIFVVAIAAIIATPLFYRPDWLRHIRWYHLAGLGLTAGLAIAAFSFDWFRAEFSILGAVLGATSAIGAAIVLAPKKPAKS